MKSPTERDASAVSVTFGSGPHEGGSGFHERDGRVHECCGRSGTDERCGSSGTDDSPRPVRAALSAAWLCAGLLVLWPPSATKAQVPPPAVAAPVLAASPESSTDGVYQLAWDGAPGAMVVEESPTAEFEAPTLVYRGLDRATVVTGRPDGVYHYRLRRDEPAAGSTTLAETVVQVRHHPLSRAIGFFFAGLFVFVATVWLVVRGPDDPVIASGGRSN